MFDELRFAFGFVALFMFLVLSSVLIAFIIVKIQDKCENYFERRKYRERLNNFLDRCQNTDAAPFSREEVQSILAFIKVLEDEYKNA